VSGVCTCPSVRTRQLFFDGIRVVCHWCGTYHLIIGQQYACSVEGVRTWRGLVYIVAEAISH